MKDMASSSSIAKTLQARIEAMRRRSLADDVQAPVVCAHCDGSGWMMVDHDGCQRATRCVCRSTARATDARLAGILAAANIPPACHAWTIDSYRTKFGAAKLTRALPWIDLPNSQRSDLVLFGEHGTGKTGMGIALLRASVDRGQSVMFWTLKHLAIVWRATFERALTDVGQAMVREQELLQQVVAVDVLMLDELGGTTLTDFVESTLSLIIDQRQKHLRPTILTLNLSAQDVVGGKKAIGERCTALLGGTLSDRLREHGQWLAMFGASKRRTYGHADESDAAAE